MEGPDAHRRELEPLGDPYRPYRTVIAWYCWRAVELDGGAADSALTRWRVAASRRRSGDALEGRSWHP